MEEETMVDPPPDARSPDETDDEEEGTPRWVYAFGILIAVGVLGFVALHLLGGGFPAHTHP
jgi:hypothetical protein